MFRRGIGYISCEAPSQDGLTIVERLDGNLEEHTLLGINSFGLFGGDGEELGSSVSVVIETEVLLGLKYRVVECCHILLEEVRTAKTDLFLISCATCK